MPKRKTTELCPIAKLAVPAVTTPSIAQFVRSRLFWNASLSGATCPHLPKLHGYDEERRRLAVALRRTTEHGESNSLLVVGPRGCGKTLLLETALQDAQVVGNSDDELPHVVRLNGLLQTDDQLALRELARQLCLENVIDGGDRVLGSFAEQLQFLLDALRSGDRQRSRPVVVVLDEFDLFAQHKNQALLYNLFDVTQSRQTPTFVIGLTCRLDVFELLEKRVKSRFSHRAIYMFAKPTFKEYARLFHYYLSAPADDAAASIAWNACVDKLLDDAYVHQALEQCHRVAADARSIQRIAFLSLCRADACGGIIGAADVLEAAKAATADSRAAVLRGVSVLELTLMVAMRQLADAYDGEPCNFSMVYERYRVFCERSGSAKACEKPVALKAFEHLVELELVQSSAGDCGVRGNVQKEYGLVRMLVDDTQLAEALQTYTGCPTEVKQWASSMGAL